MTQAGALFIICIFMIVIVAGFGIFGLLLNR